MATKSIVKRCESDGKLYVFKRKSRNCDLQSGNMVELPDGEIAEILGYAKIENREVIWFQILGEPAFQYYSLSEIQKMKLAM